METLLLLRVPDEGEIARRGNETNLQNIRVIESRGKMMVTR
jgi:hypothetical protein